MKNNRFLYRSSFKPNKLICFWLLISYHLGNAQTSGLHLLGGAQLILQQGTVITLTNNGGLKVDGSGSALINNGTLVLSGSFINQNAGQVSGGDYKIGGSFTNTATFQTNGVIELASYNPCVISSVSPLNNITINKANFNPIVNLGSNLSINGTLNFAADATFIQLNAYNLQLTNQVVKGSEDYYSFIITNSTGSLEQYVQATQLYPIGTTSTNYSPLSISNVSSNIPLQVRVQNNVQAVVGGTTTLTTGVVNKSWIVSESTPTINKNLTLTAEWESSDELIGFNTNKCGVSRWNTTTSAWDLTLANMAARSGSNPYYRRTRSDITDIGTFSIMSINTTVLPMSLLDFKVNSDNKTAFLVWQTAEERNLSHYTIEKSTDGQVWTNIGQVKAAALNSYRFNDDTAFVTSANVFYRLHIVDLDGSFYYSPIRQVVTGKKSSLQVFPNPARHTIIVQGIETDEQWCIIDVLGRVIADFKGEKEINLSTYTEGVYFIRTSRDRIAKFVKAN